jgi:hypothetical protein
MSQWINLTALWKIIVIGLLAGAGLPALFAIGLRALNTRPQATSAEGDGQVAVSGGVLGMAAAALCFAVVLAAIGWGIYSIVHNS